MIECLVLVSYSITISLTNSLSIKLYASDIIKIIPNLKYKFVQRN